jgi:putative DNA primase/helicase
MQCETTSHTDAILKLARSERCVVVEHDAFDRDPFLLNLRNGIYDLRNHQFVAHRKELLISRLVPLTYIPDAQCPKWLAFLERIFRSREDKNEIIQFLQRFLGYCLTGSTDEQVLLLLYGAGENGKSVLLNVLNKLLGDYAANAAATTFTTVRSEAVRNDLARLDGVRVVTAIEANKNAVIDESLIKQITGGDIITARFLFKEEFEYRPQFKLLWAFNHKPHIRDATHSIWRRIILLPFEEKINPSERILGLDDILVSEEGPGILAWMIQGLMHYQQQGLQPPSSVMLATKEYRNESDVLFEFIQDVCLVLESSEVLGGDYRVPAKELYLAYKEWCAHNNEPKVMSTTKFGREMSDRGFKKARMNTGQYYIGIKLKGKL